mgnify:CR=1 FL=1
MVAKVEHWNPFAKIRQDLWNFADLLAVKADTTLLVQTTTGDNLAARLAKIQASQAAQLWLESPTRRVVVHGWAKRGARGKRKQWTCREVEPGVGQVPTAIPLQSRPATAGGLP